MQLLLKNVRIIDKKSSHHLQSADILVENGVITKIAPNIENNEAKVFQFNGASVSPGWVDMNCHIFEPGLEYREDIQSGLQAAANGGFTSVCMMPNTNPPIDTKGQVDYLNNASARNVSSILPVGAISKDLSGKDLSEIYDMYDAGAVAFSDGYRSVQNSGLMDRALLYVKKFDGVVFNLPNDEQIAHHGNMNEGIMSTQLGMHASPKLAEELMVARDIYLAEDTGSRLHFSCISTAKSVDLVRQAKKRGVRVTAAVNAYNLLLDDTALADFDTNYKVNPHLRNPEDIAALLEGLKDGTIDAIASGHMPLHIDEKKVEFDNAEYGMSTLDTAFAVARKATSGVLTEEQLIEKFLFAYNLLRVERPLIEENEAAVLTVFNADDNVVFEWNQILSKSKNTPFTGMSLQGKVFGVINQNKTNLI